ncbi:MAG: translocation/assembly module TamB domain-containing protein, partial [Myxococcota bacterium]|nr:translocation/assembly module TamB domain-containing protein [Myxococcota bacterium]
GTTEPDTEPEPTQSSTNFNIELGSVHLWNTRLDIDLDAFAFRASGLDLSLLPEAWSDHRISIDLKSGHLDIAGQAIPLEIRGTTVLSGSLTEPSNVQLQDLRVFLPRIAVAPRGSIALSEDLSAQLDFQAHGSLAELNKRIEDLPSFAGTVRATGSVTGPLTAPIAAAEVAFTELGIDSMFLGDVTTKVRFDGTKLDLMDLVLQHPKIGRLDARAKIGLSANLPSEIRANLAPIQAGPLFELLEFDYFPVDGTLRGALTATGSLNPFSLDISLEQDLTNIEIYDRDFRDERRVPLLELAGSRLAGRVRSTTDLITLERLVLTRGSTNVGLTGTLDLTGNGGLEVRTNATDFDFKNFGRISDIDMRGRGLLATTIEGPYSNVVVSATAELRDFGIETFRFGETNATLIYSGSSLQVARVGIARYPGQITGSAELILEESARFEGEFDLEGVAMTPLLDSLGVLEGQSERFAGLLSGTASISGPIIDPTVVAKAHTDAMKLDGVSLGPTQATIRLSPGTEWFSMEASHRPVGGKLDYRLGFVGADELAVNFEMNRIPMKVITPFMGDLDIHGALSGQGQLQGAPTSLTGQLSLQADAISAYDIALGYTDLRAKAVDGQVSVEGTCLNGRARVLGNMRVGETIPYTMTTEFENVDTEEIYAVPDGVKLNVTGSLFSQGDVFNPEAMIADIILTGAKLNLGGFAFTESNPVRLNYANQVLEFSDASFETQHLSFKLEGSAPVTGSLGLRLKVNGNLAVLSSSLETVESANGWIGSTLLIEGDRQNPSLTGEATIKDGRIRLTSLAEDITNLDTVVNISGRTFQLTRGSARIGDGIADFAGNIILQPEGRTAADLRADFKSVQLRPSPELKLDLSGQLNLLGEVGNFELRGDLDINSLQYTANFDLENLLTRRPEPLPVPTFEPGEAWRLRVNVRADDNIIFASNFAEAELSANFRVTGTSERIGAIGTLTPLWGRATYGGNTYEVEQAIIDLTEEYRISPRFDIRAKGEACEMDLSVNIFGDDTGYNIEARGQDENGTVPPDEALFCAQFGLRLNSNLQAAQDGTGAGGAGAGSVYLPGAVDAIWKVTGMDERVRRIIPVLDQFTLTSGYSKATRKTEPRILMTKELGKDWELKYNGPLYTEKDNQHIIALEYRLNNRVTLESTWESVSAASIPIGDLGLDLRLDWQFE